MTGTHSRRPLPRRLTLMSGTLASRCDCFPQPTDGTRHSNSKFANRNPAVAAGSRRKAPLVEGILCSGLLHKYNTFLGLGNAESAAYNKR